MTPPGWRCSRRIGFLFPHPCDRLTPDDCPHCQNGQINDPYRNRTRDEYTSDYEAYDSTDVTWYGADVASGAAFTESDGEFLLKPEHEFEDDLGES